MTAYYFEPTAQLMTEQSVAQQIGQVACDWCHTRQAELGLYQAYFDYSTPYNKYTQTLSGFVWTKFETLDELREADPEACKRLIASRIYKDAGAFYLQRWTVIDLEGEAATNATQLAKLVVAKEAARLLATVSGFANKTGCPDAITDYVFEILGIVNHEGFPHILATEVDDGSFSSWPVYPDLSLALDSIANAPAATTNADIAFNRILGSYTVPGTYSEKVSAITSAVAEYGMNGTVSNLYNFAVGILTE